jgi:hypothetical protein
MPFSKWSTLLLQNVPVRIRGSKAFIAIQN